MNITVLVSFPWLLKPTNKKQLEDRNALFGLYLKCHIPLLRKVGQELKQELEGRKCGGKLFPGFCPGSCLAALFRPI